MSSDGKSLSEPEKPQSSESSRIRDSLNKITYFDDWDIKMKEECEKFSKMKSFKNDEIIYGRPFNTNQYVYFIVKGKAKVVQIIQFRMDGDKKDNPEKNDADVYCIEVFNFSEMSCFNIGEDLHDRIIIACSNNTECLLIPRFWLLEINRKLWHRMRFFFDRNIPSKEEAEERFYRKKMFSKHSRSLAKDIHEKTKKSQYNHHFNIPFSLRLNQN